jgi:CNT family concentrative nucleoside transporter
LQLLIGVVLLKLPGLEQLFIGLNELVLALQRATESGGQFVFGYLAGGSLPFEEREPGSSFILAFRALPVILVVSAVSAALTYLGVLPWVVRLFAMCLQRTLHVGGAVGLTTAANIFVGMVEAPLLVRPYLSRLTRSELFVVMTVGMATIAGTVLVLYASILGSVLEDALRHLLVASVISAPAAVTVAKLMIPEIHQPTPGVLDGSSSADGLVDAIISGTQNGLKLLLNVAALLLVLVALVHLVNALLGWLPPVAGESVTLQRITGYLLAPVAWLMGIPWSEAVVAGGLLGTKTILNEFIAYIELAQLESGTLSARSQLIMTYALCGFANFASLGIMLGGLLTLVPERRAELLQLGPRAIVSGTLASCCTGAVVGALTW